MKFKLQAETNIVIGRLAKPTSPDRAWWWQSSTMRDGADVTVGGFASTENDAILQAAAMTIDLHGAVLPDRPVDDQTNGTHADAAAASVWSAAVPAKPARKRRPAAAASAAGVRDPSAANGSGAT